MKKTVVVSAVGLTNGGPLSILLDFAKVLDTTTNGQVDVTYLIHPDIKKHFEGKSYLCFGWPKKSWFLRVFFEKLYCLWLEKRLEPSLWISLQDVTTYLRKTPSVVYCHNSSPFFKVDRLHYLTDPKFCIFVLFYGFIYQWHIHRNRYVIVQQEWLRAIFCRRYGLPESQVIVARPFEPTSQTGIPSIVPFKRSARPVKLFYPAMPRVFKNHFILGKALSLMQSRDLRILITLSGSENYYTKSLYKKFNRNVPNLEFLGFLDRRDVFLLYDQVDGLIFPSKLETWGLPLSEFQATGKMILAADLPYAYETLSNYENAKYFDPNNPKALAKILDDLVQGQWCPTTRAIKYLPPFAEGWSELIHLLGILPV